MINRWHSYTLQEASLHTGLAEETLQDLAARGALGHIEENGQIRILGKFLQELMVSLSEQTARSKQNHAQRDNPTPDNVS